MIAPEDPPTVENVRARLMEQVAYLQLKPDEDGIIGRYVVLLDDSFAVADMMALLNEIDRLRSLDAIKSLLPDLEWLVEEAIGANYTVESEFACGDEHLRFASERERMRGVGARLKAYAETLGAGANETPSRLSSLQPLRQSLPE